MDAGCEYSACLADEGDAFGCMDATVVMSKKKSKNKNKRRFSDEQIKSLETMFENETRLEPRKKVQLARELGLQPRQVAIWFQNKRARYKSKQLERDYGLLRANYNSLASRFDNLKKEKQALLVQLQKLNEIMRKSEEDGQCCGQLNSIDGESDNGDATTKTEVEEKASLSLSAERSEQGIGVVSDDDTSCIKAEYFGLEEEANLMELVEPADSSLTSPEDWGNFESDDLFNQSSTNYQWWDFWS